MTSEYEAIASLKYRSAEEMASTVGTFADKFQGSEDSIVTTLALEPTSVFYLRDGDVARTTVRVLAVLALLLEEIGTVMDPYLRHSCIANVRTACETLHVSYSDALSFSSHAEEIRRLLV